MISFKHCVQCQKSYPSSNNYCSECGHVLNTRHEDSPTPPLEAQQGEDEIGKALLNDLRKLEDTYGIDLISKVCRPSQSASREIKKSVAEARTDGGMDEKEILAELNKNPNYEDGLSEEQKATLKQLVLTDNWDALTKMMQISVNLTRIEDAKSFCTKFAHPDVKPLIEALETIIKKDMDCTCSITAQNALSTYKPNAGRQ